MRFGLWLCACEICSGVAAGVAGGHHHAPLDAVLVVLLLPVLVAAAYTFLDALLFEHD